MAGFGDVAAGLVKASRSLREFEALLTDPDRTRFVVVARAAELPRAETIRLIGALGPLGVALGGVVVDALTPPGCARCKRIARRECSEIARLVKSLPAARSSDVPVVLAPAVAPPPRGARSLRGWARTWRRFSGIDSPFACADNASSR
jgi:anion-transporting  ArsA/GET3 family ATPase